MPNKLRTIETVDFGCRTTSTQRVSVEKNGDDATKLNKWELVEKEGIGGVGSNDWQERRTGAKNSVTFEGKE